MTPQKPIIEIVEQDLIESVETQPLFIELFTKVLDKHPSECLLTDLSTLSDFTGCGMPWTDAEEALSYKEYVAAWDQWAIRKVYTEFKVKLDRTTYTLLQVYAMLEAPRPPTVH